MDTLCIFIAQCLIKRKENLPFTFHLKKILYENMDETGLAQDSI
jgi:hypothetical protein